MSQYGPYLVKRKDNTRFYLRSLIPKDLNSYWPKNRFWFPFKRLKSKKPGRARLLRHETQTILAKIRLNQKRPTIEEIKRTIKERPEAMQNDLAALGLRLATLRVSRCYARSPQAAPSVLLCEFKSAGGQR